MCRGSIDVMPSENSAADGAGAPSDDPSFDTARQEAFADRLVGALNDGALLLMISIGHRTGLFDTLAGMDAATSESIAARAKLDERYVREWLGAMTTGGVVEFDAGARTWRLPAEHAAHLTRAAVPANIAATSQWFAVLGGVESRIVECFREGGGVPYAAFERFHEVMAEESEQTTVVPMVDTLLPVVDGLTEKLRAGIDVLDAGCGRGRALMEMARAFPDSRFTGYDVSEEAVAWAREEAARRGLDNLSFELKDVSTSLDDEDAYDLVCTFDSVHDQADPAAMLAGIDRALCPDGTFFMQDIAGHVCPSDILEHPLGTFLYTISCMHCMTVSLAQDGAGLGAMWGEELALQMLGEAGFTDVTVQHLPHDEINAYYVARR